MSSGAKRAPTPRPPAPANDASDPAPVPAPAPAPPPAPSPPKCRARAMRLFAITGNGSCTRRDNGMYEPRVRMRVSESVYRSRSRWHTPYRAIQPPLPTYTLIRMNLSVFSPHIHLLGSQLPLPLSSLCPRNSTHTLVVSQPCGYTLPCRYPLATTRSPYPNRSL